MKHPKELLRDFDGILSKLQGSKDLTSEECRQIANDLTEIYNYVSESTKEPSSINLVYAISAQEEKRRKQLECERKALKDAQQFIDDNFDKAEQYLRAIQLGGYAAFFGLWSISKDLLDPLWTSISAVLMIISCSTFIIWEISKASILTLALKRHATMSAGKIEQFLTSRIIKLSQENSTHNVITQARPTFWIISILPAVAAIAILLLQLLGNIAKLLFG